MVSLWRTGHHKPARHVNGFYVQKDRQRKVELECSHVLSFDLSHVPKLVPDVKTELWCVRCGTYRTAVSADRSW